MNLFETHGGTDWATDPDWYVTDLAFYLEKIKKGRQALVESGASKISFQFAGEPEGSGFLDVDEDFPEDQEPILYLYEDWGKGKVRVPAYIVETHNYDPRWEGPELIVWADEVELRWSAKNGDEILWVTLEHRGIVQGELLENYL